MSTSKFAEAAERFAQMQQANAQNTPDYDMYTEAAGAAIGAPTTSPEEVVRDLETMRPFDFMQKWGVDTYQELNRQRVQAENEYRNDRFATSVNAEPIRDTAVDVGRGLGNAVLGIAAFGAGVVDDKAGVIGAQGVGLFNEFADSLTSDAGNARSRAYEGRQAATRRENEILYENERRTDGEFIASMRRIGRDVLSTGANITEDGAIVGDVVAEGAGSLLAAGPLMKAINKAGGGVLGAMRTRGVLSRGSYVAAARAGNAVTPSLAIGAMEGGGAYADAAQEVMGMDFTTLRENSEDFRKLVEGGMSEQDARIAIADAAGDLAAGIAGVGGAITGRLVSKFEAAPLAKVTSRQAAGNIAREGLEEATQGGIAPTAVNVGVREYADETKELTEGVGEGITEGAIGGVGAGGVTSGPSLARSIIEDTSKKAFGIVSEKLIERYEAGKAAGTQAIKRGWEETRDAAGEMFNIMREQFASEEVEPEVAAANEEVINRFEDAASFDAEPYSDIDDVIVQSAMAKSSDVFEAMQNLAGVVMAENTSQESKDIAGDILLRLQSDISDMANSGILDEVQGLDESDPVYKKLASYMDMLQMIGTAPAVTEAVNAAIQRLQNAPAEDTSPRTADNGSDATSDAEAAGTQTEATSTEGSSDAPVLRHEVDRVLAQARHAPTKADPARIDTILRQEKGGGVRLSKEQRASLIQASALAQAARESMAFSKNINDPAPTDVVSAEITNGEPKQGRPKSVQQQMRNIVNFLNSGDVQEASALMEELGAFAQHMQNKAAALNSLVPELGGGVTAQTTFQARNHKTGEFYEGLTPKVHSGSPNSIRLAQRIHKEARAVARAYNVLAESMPELGAKPVDMVEIDAVFQAPSDEVAAFFKAGGAVERQQEAPQEPQETQEAPEPTPEPEVQEEVSEEPEATPEPQETEQNEDDVPEPEPVEQQPEAVEAEQSTAEPEAAAVSEKPAKRNVRSFFPNLMKSSMLGKAFRVPATQRTRFEGDESPLATLYDIMSSSQRFTRFVGEELKKTFTPEISQAYQQYLQAAVPVKAAMLRQMQEYLNTPWKNGAIPTEMLKNGRELGRTLDGRALNLLDETEDGLAYNSNLLDTSIMAGLQWALTGFQEEGHLDTDAAASILGIEEAAQWQANKLNEGMTLIAAKRSLASFLTRYWGLTKNPDAAKGYTEGVPEAVATELLIAMNDAGLIQLELIEGKDLGTYRDVYQIRHSFLTKAREETKEKGEKYIKSPLMGFSDAIEYAVMLEPERQMYIGEAPSSVLEKQARNPMVDITEEQKATIKAEQKTPHRIDTLMFDFIRSLGQGGVLQLFAEGSLDENNTNAQHFLSLDGRNRTFAAAFQQIEHMVENMKNYAETNGMELGDVPIFFDYEFSRVNRLQMKGLHNPQANKLTREVILPTHDTLDLNDPDALSMFNYALGQALGLKIHKMPEAAMLAELAETLEKLQPAIDVIEAWQDGGEASGLQAEDIETIRSAFGGSPDVVAIHALMDYVRMKNASADELSSFPTSLYIEADGVTNGPVNAMMMLTSGAFTPEWFKNMRKGGLFPNGPSSMNTQADQVDLYETTTNHMVGIFNAFRQSVRGTKEQWKADRLDQLLRMMDVLGMDVTFREEKNGEAEIKIKRGAAKNPLTITIYGSSATGIAGNVTDTIIEEISAKLTDALRAKKANPKLDLATAMFGTDDSEWSQQRMVYLADSLKSLTGFDVRQGWTSVNALQKFQFTKEQREKLKKSVLNSYVSPLRMAIQTTLAGDMLFNADIVRRATQAQSIFMKAEFLKRVREELEKLKDDPEAKTTDFLSDNQLDKIYRELLKKYPMIQTGVQNLLVGASQSADLPKNVNFGNALDGSLKTPGFVHGPKNAGVGGIPYSVISMGDGRMMQILATIDAAPEGTLKVFDGMHMKLSTARTDSVKSNEAAWGAWLSNPMKAIAESYETFYKNMKISDLDYGLLKELDRALNDPGANPMMPEEMVSAMKGLRDILANNSAEITARHAVLSRVKGLSVDQMASIGQPFVREEGDIDLTGLDETQIAEKLNLELAKEMRKLGSKSKPRSNAIPKELEAEGRVAPSGARILSATSLRNLARTMNIPREQKRLFRELIRLTLPQDYTIVYGTNEQLDAYMEAENIPNPGLRDGTAGVTLPASKHILLAQPSSETLVHEMIHAATFAVIDAYYSGGDMGSNRVEKAKAIKRMEAQMQDFLLMDVSKERADVQREHKYAVKAIEAAPNYAVALNEFMAWGLANEQLSNLLKRKEVSPLAKLAKSVIDGIKRLVWGRRATDKAADDMFSNLRFNTMIVAQSAATQPSSLETALFQHRDYGMDSNLAEFAKTFTMKIARHVKYDPADLRSRKRAEETQRAVEGAIDLTNGYAANGFSMTAQQATAFRSIVTAMSTGAQLDGNIMSRITELYSHVQRELRPEDLMEDPTSQDQNAIYVAQQQYNTVMGNNVRQKDAYGRSSVVPAFLALSIVHPTMKRALERMALPENQKDDTGTLDGILYNAGTGAMNKLSDLLTGADRNDANVAEALNTFAAQLEEVSQDRQGWFKRLTDPAGNIIDKGNDFVTKYMEKSGAYLDEVGTKLSNTGNRIAKVTGGVLSITGAMLNQDTAAEVAENMVASMNNLSDFNPLNEFLNELIGRTKSNASVYDMIKGVRSMIQQVRQQFREGLPQILNSKYAQKVSEEQWTAMFRGMGKTDIAALSTSGRASYADIINMLAKPAAFQSRVRDTEAEVQKLNKPDFDLIKKKAKELANFMVTGEVPQNLLRNAYAVAALNGEISKGRTPSNDLVRAVNELITLYAMERNNEVNPSDTAALRDLAQNDPEGLTFTLAYLKGQREEEVRKVAQTGGKENHYKGWLPSEPDGNAHIIVQDDSNRQFLEEMSYVRVGDYEGSSLDRNAPKMGYYMAQTPARAQFMQGIIQNVRQTAGGVDLETGYTIGLQTAGRITNPEEVRSITRRLSRGEKGTEKLLPIYEGGQVVAYERSLSPQIMSMVESNTNLAEMIGVWRGRQVEELLGRQSNKALLGNLKDMWDKDKNTPRRKEYVNILTSKDPVVRDAVSLMTNEMMAEAQEAFDGEPFLVRKDMLNDVLGYRSASVSDMWSGNSRWSPETQEKVRKMLIGAMGNKAYERVVNGERFIQGVVTDAKVLIVIKSVIVPFSNMLANVYQLISRGVPIGDIAKKFPEKTAEIDSYIKGRAKYMELEAELRTVEKNPRKSLRIKNQMQAIEDGYRRLSIWPLIESGEFSSISDAAVTHEERNLSRGKFAEYLEAQVDKLPDSVKTAGRYAIIGRDTALFQGLQRAIEYGDFLGKAVLYDELTQRKGMTPEQAKARITEEFVNYDRLPGRTRGYLEQMGLLWFWNFKIRSVKVALSILRNNPLHALFANMLPQPELFGSVGSPVSDNLFSVWMDDRLGYSIGPEMGYRSLFLNPWVNMTS